MTFDLKHTSRILLLPLSSSLVYYSILQGTSINFNRPACLLLELPALGHGFGENLQHGLGVLPPDTSVRDAHAVLETGFALRRDLLGTCREVVG